MFARGMEGRRRTGRKGGREGGRNEGRKGRKVKVWCQEQSTGTTLRPEVRQARGRPQMAQERPAGPAGKGRSAGPAAPEGGSCLRLGKAPPGTPLSWDDRPEAFKLWLGEQALLRTAIKPTSYRFSGSHHTAIGNPS